ncbi:MAG: response regulator [Desulfuromonadaceae bacterium]
MRVLLVADKDTEFREQMKKLFSSEKYQVKLAGSVVEVLRNSLKNTAQVLLMGMEFDNVMASDLIPLLKKCNKEMAIILVTDDDSLSLLRKVRGEGIFYHALKPVTQEDKDELKMAVKCAFDKFAQSPAGQVPALQRIESPA